MQETRRTHVAALGGFGPEGDAGFQKSLPGCHQRAQPSAGDHHLGLRLVQLQKNRWMGCYNDDQKKKKKRVLARWRERRSGSLSYDCVERFLHACGCGIRKSTQSTEDNGSGVLSIWPHRRRHRLPHADTEFFLLLVFQNPDGNFLRGWRAALCCYITAWGCSVGHLETSRQQPGATDQGNVVHRPVSGTVSPGRGFPPLTPLFKRDSVTHRRDGRDTPRDLSS
jgi:hypothetical protein